MDQAVTVGALVWFLVIVAGVAGVLGVLFFILSIIGEGFRH